MEMMVGSRPRERPFGAERPIPRRGEREEWPEARVESRLVGEEARRVALKRIGDVRAQGTLHEIARGLGEDLAATDDGAIVPVLALRSDPEWIVARIAEE